MLALEHLSKTYADGTRALSDIALTVGVSEIVALIGGSGCGKTTLLRLIAGLDRASAGTIRLDGEVIEHPHAAVGIVFQEPRLLPWLSVADNVGFGLEATPPAERKARIAHALEKVGLAEYAGRWPRDLSGGQQQRVAIARAFVANPKVLLLDEPFSALDAPTRESVLLDVVPLLRQRAITTVLVTHDPAEAFALGDRVAVLLDGRVAQIDTPSELVHRPSSEAVAAFIRPRDPLAALAARPRPTFLSGVAADE
jgi:sulfonate transport system ATP-binding protein